jgi:hypothetical protein
MLYDKPDAKHVGKSSFFQQIISENSSIKSRDKVDVKYQMN